MNGQLSRFITASLEYDNLRESLIHSERSLEEAARELAQAGGLGEDCWICGPYVVLSVPNGFDGRTYRKAFRLIPAVPVDESPRISITAIELYGTGEPTHASAW